jgi:hypothetical protein
MTSPSPATLAGVYYLHGVKETASGIKLNPDGSFQFFFSYGALDRSGSGTWTLQDDTVYLNSRPWSGLDFALMSASTSGNGITVRINDRNPMFYQHVFASLLNGADGSWRAPDKRGEIHFDVRDASSITLVFEFCPERFSTFPVTTTESNYFEFRLEPWVMEVFFSQFPLKAKKNVLLGRHPLLRGNEYIYEKS